MADAKPDSTRTKRQDDRPLTFLTRLIMLLLAAGLVISVCMTAYMTMENVRLKRSNRDLMRRMERAFMLHQFAQRLVAELGALSRRDPEAGVLLHKHAQAISQLDLDSQARQFAPDE